MGKSPKEIIEAASPMRLWFDDECPRIGSGMRYCDIKVGRKWVFIIDTANGNRAKMSMEDAFPIIMGSIKRSSR